MYQNLVSVQYLQSVLCCTSVSAPVFPENELPLEPHEGQAYPEHDAHLSHICFIYTGSNALQCNNNNNNYNTFQLMMS